MTHENTVSDAPADPRRVEPVRSPQGLATACAVLAALAIWWLFPQQPVWAVLPAILAAGAVEFWLLARRPAPGPMARARRGGWLDRSSGLCSTAALSHFGDPMLRHALRKSQPLTLVLLDLPDLRELETLYGPNAARHALRTIGAKLRGLAGGNGIAVRLGKHSFALLLPAASRQAAIDRVAARLGRAAAFELEWEHHEIVLLPSVFICTATPDDASVVALYTRCRKELERWVQPRPQPRRGSHAPAASPAGAAVSIGPLAAQNEVTAHAPLPPTVPAPLGRENR